VWLNAGMTNHFTVRVGDDGAMDRAARGFAVGAGVTLAVAVFARGVAAAVNAWWPTPDANIGLGLLLFGAEIVLIPLGVGLTLRLLRMPGATLIAAGTPVIFLLALFASPVDPASIASVLVEAAAVAIYTGAAAWVARRRG
jgi:hypothetical protein